MPTIVAALGGSLLRPEIEGRQTWLSDLTDMVKEIVSNGTHLGLVIGGGSPARECINLAKPLIDDVISLDKIGIAATRLNATIIREVLLGAGISTCYEIPHTIEDAVTLMDKFSVVLMGGTKPGQTTDTVAVKLAVATNSSKCIIATNVTKVYEEDPKNNINARSYDTLTLDQLQEIVGPPEHSKAGISQVVGPIGVACAAVNKMTLNILDGRNMENIKNAIEEREFQGTVVSG